MGISGNAPAFPLIALRLPTYTPVPFTNRILQVKGDIMHGWVNSEPVKNFFIHQKSGYLQIQLPKIPIKPSIGLIHIAQWGGENQNKSRKINSSFNAFWHVLWSLSPGESNQNFESSYRVGNHLGIWDTSLDIELTHTNIKLYWQHPFEDYSGLVLRNWRDGLWGLNISFNRYKKTLVTNILAEHIYTKHQTGAGYPNPTGNIDTIEENNGLRFNGRDNYYNHNDRIYTDGWTSNTFVIGNPLFLTNGSLKEYKKPGIFYDGFIASNRLVSYHMGIKGWITPYISHRHLITRVTHYGTWNGLYGENYLSTPNGEWEINKSYVFLSGLTQWSFLSEWEIRQVYSDTFHINLSLAIDQGELYNSVGLLLGLKLDILE